MADGVTDKIILDPLFTIPEGAEEVFVYSKDSIIDLDLSTIDIDGYDGPIDDSQDYSDDGSVIDVLDFPTNVQIVDMRLRRSPGGTDVVDVVISCDDVSGATNYEIQVTKA